MQTNAEGGIRFSELNGFCEGRSVYHEAGGGQDAVAMGAHNGLIDGS
jgi:hypothetical protein